MAKVVSLAPSMCAECLCDSMNSGVENGGIKKCCKMFYYTENEKEGENYLNVFNLE